MRYKSSSVRRSVFSSASRIESRAIVFDFEPHRVTFATIVQFVFDRLEQIGGFLFIDVKLAVARDAEMPVAKNLCAGKKIAQVVADQVARERCNPGGLLARQFHHARQDARNLHDGQVLQHFAIAAPFRARTIIFSDLFSNCGKGWAGSIASGVSTGRTWAR